jgi:hypothetical protein
MTVTLMLTVAVAMVIMNIMTRMGSKGNMDERVTRLATCMHIEAYDTQAVPYHERNSRYFHQHILHSNPQR